MPSVVDISDGTPDETRMAAEAVVDAASKYQLVRVGKELSPQTKAVLLRALVEDPSLTEYLFSYAGIEIQ